MLSAELLHELLDQWANLGRRGVSEGDQAVGQVGRGVGGIELFDQRFNDGKIFGGGSHQQASGTGFWYDREAGRALTLLGLGLGLITTPPAAGTKDIVQGSGHHDGVGLCQRENAQIALTRGGLPREVDDHAVDPIQFWSWA